MSGFDSRGAAPSPPGPRLALALCALALCVGAALRALGLASDLWLDEIWTWASVRALPDAASVFTLHDSNNHYLNTLWFYAAGDTASGWWLRLRFRAALSDEERLRDGLSLL